VRGQESGGVIGLDWEVFLCYEYLSLSETYLEHVSFRHKRERAH